MENCEGPGVPFQIFRQRFKEGPDEIIYDNGCSFSHYAYNRDPGHFWRTKFLCDKVHWKNHQGCSEGFNSSAYPYLEKVNTNVAEHRNRKLRDLESMVSYMTTQNFVLFVKLFSAHENMLQIAKMVDPLDNSIPYISVYRKFNEMMAKQK